MNPGCLSQLLLPLILVITLGVASFNTTQVDEPTELIVLWTSGDPEIAHRVALMYTHAAKTSKWYRDVRLIVWGPSAKLLSEDLEIQAKLKSMQDDGIKTQACIVCANSYGVTEKLRDLKLDVKPMGQPLSDFLKDRSVNVITF